MTIYLGGNYINYSPYFGHLQLVRDGKEIEVQVGLSWDIKIDEYFTIPDGLDASDPDIYAENSVSLGVNISEVGAWDLYVQASNNMSNHYIPYRAFLNSNSFANTLLNVTGQSASDFAVYPGNVLAYPGINANAANRWDLGIKYDLHGDALNNIIVGSIRADKLEGREGVDFIDGSYGDDHLYANSTSAYDDGAADYLVGGGGADQFYIGANSSGAKVSDGLEGFLSGYRNNIDIIRDYSKIVDTVNIVFDDSIYGVGFSGSFIDYSVSPVTYDYGNGAPVQLKFGDKDIYEFSTNTGLVYGAGAGLEFGALYDDYYDTNLQKNISVLVVFELETYTALFGLEVDFDGQPFGTTGAPGSNGAPASNNGAPASNSTGGASDALHLAGSEDRIIDVSEGTSTTTFNEVQSFSDIVAFFGSSGNDSFLDDGNVQLYVGNLGNDSVSFVDDLGSVRIQQSGDGYLVTRGYSSESGYAFGDSGKFVRLEDIENISFNGQSMLVSDAAVQEIQGTGSTDTILGLAFDEDIFGKDGDDTIYGNGGNDILIGGAGADSLYGGDGNDRIVIDEFDIFWSGGAGIDTLVYTGGVSKQYALAQDAFEHAEFGSGGDTIWGTSGANHIDGGAGDDFLFGYAGNDILVGGAGSDSLQGGDGDDRIVIDEFDSWYSGGAGIDTVVYLGGAGIQYALAQGDFEHAEFGFGNDTIWGTSGVNSINGGAGDDSLFGYAGNDILVGGAGSDSLQGGDGDDRIVIDEFDSWYSGGAGIDTVVYLGGADIQYALAQGDFEHAEFGSGNDTIWGTSGVNNINGGAGDDELLGYGGNDVLVGGAGSDSLQGGDGDDRIVIDEFDSWYAGNAGIDTVVYTGGADMQYALAQGDFEHAEFGSGNDTIWGNASNNIIDGGAGSDGLFGYGGADTLIGGVGDDYMYGGVGADVFVFSDNTGNDIIHDFEDSIDHIDLANVTSINSFSDVLAAATQVGGNVIIDLGSGSTLELEQFDIATQLDSSDFLFV